MPEKQKICIGFYPTDIRSRADFLNEGVLFNAIPEEKVMDLIKETEQETGSSGHTALRLLKQKMELFGEKR